MTRVATAIFLAVLAAFAAATPVFAQSDWSTVRTTPMVSMEIRTLVGVLMLVPAGTLYVLYLYRPRPYVLAGVIAWTAASVMMLVLGVDAGTPNAQGQVPVRRVAIVVWAVAALVFGAGLRLSAAWFRAPATIPREVFWGVALAVAWLVGATFLLHPMAMIAPVVLMMTLWMGRAAVSYLTVARSQRLAGALVTGGGVSGMVIVNSIALVVGLATGSGAASREVAYFNFISAALLVLGMHLLIFEDVMQELRTAAGELTRSRDEMKTMAVTDPLTRCYNRRFLYEIAEHELEQHRRFNQSLSLLYIDIDHFKAINDQRGHQTGDEVLKTMGAILRELTRQADFVFRWGGDEFLVLLSAEVEDARIKAQKIREAFLESAIVKNLPDGVDVSIGVVAVPPDTKDFDPLIDQADREMYRRKRTLASS